MSTQYRIVPKNNFRWGIEKLVKPACWYTKAQWEKVLFSENFDIECRNLSLADKADEKKYRPMYGYKKYTYSSQEEAEMYIDYELANEKKVNQHMATPPREYP